MKANHLSLTRGRKLSSRSLRQRADGWMARFLPLLTFIVLTAGAAQAATVFGVDTANNLVRFNSATPGTIVSSTPITGLAGGESIVAIDFRPHSEQLFGLGSSSRLYVIDPATAVATPVGSTAFVVPLNGTSFGFDFNPVVDRIRLVSDADQNMRLNPNDGTVVDFDTGAAGTQPDANLAYASGDPNAAQNPNVVGSAYNNNEAGSTATTLYGIDTNLDILVTQNPPNDGTLNTVGALGVDASDVLGFDIQSGNVAFASMVVAGTTNLYTINLTTGQATLVGATGNPNVRGIAISPPGFSNTVLSGMVATFTGDTAANSVTFDQSGGLLRHNRFSAGDSGFSSDFDFDTTIAGDQTLSATDPAVTIIVNGGNGDDRVFIGSNSAPYNSLAASFEFHGQGGGDVFTINDSASSTGRTIDILTPPFPATPGTISHDTIEALNVLAGSGSDTIWVQAGSSVVTSIFAGDGDDIVRFNNGATLFGGLVDGGTGANTLDYSAYSTPVAVDLHETQTLFLSILSGMQEPGPLSNSQGSGRGIFLLNATQTELSFDISYAGLDGMTMTGAHFHNAPQGVNGPIVRGLTTAEQNGSAVPAGTMSGVWTASDPSGIGGPASSGPLTPGLVAELLANRIYFNIHTNLFPSGELRGQLIAAGPVGTATGTSGVRSFSTVLGGSNNDTITGTTGGQTLNAGPGADTIIWNNGDGSDVMEGGPGDDTVQVNGSPAGGDQFLIQVNPVDPARLRFDRTNLGLFNLDIGTVEALDFNTLGGADTTTVEFAGGDPIPANGIDFDGGAGDDRLVLQRSAGSFAATTIAHIGSGTGAGSVDVDGSIVTYSDLAPVDDTVPATNFTFTAPAGSSALNVVDGPVVGGFQTAQINSPTNAFELINFARKTKVTINPGTVAQVIGVNNPTPAAGLSNLTVNGSLVGDEMNITAVPPGVATTVNARDQDDIVRVSGAGVPSGTTLLLDGGTGFDRLIYETGGVPVTTAPGPNPGQTTITRPGSGTVVYQNFEDVTYNFGSINLVKLTNGTDNDTAPGPSVAVGSTVTFTYRVTNPGNVPLNNVTVRDDNGTPGDTADDFNATFSGGDTNANSLLEPSETWTFTASRVATAGQYTNVGTATGNPPAGSGGPVSDTNPDNHFGGSAPGTAAQPLNISTRLQVQSGENVLIGGFIITGEQSKDVIVRAIGPSLAGSGVTGVLADPVIELRGPNGELIATNDNWRSDDEADIQASGVAPSNDLEAAIRTTLEPEGYTVIVTSKTGVPGVGLVEAYDLDTAAASALANISTRGFVTTGENVMIGGFILGGGGGEATIAIRGLGPSLETSGVVGVLVDPVLDLRDSNGVRLILNDDWMDNPAQAVQLSANGLAPTRNSEAGIFTSLPPGAFTAILSGKNGTSGVGLIEVYHLE